MKHAYKTYSILLLIIFYSIHAKAQQDTIKKDHCSFSFKGKVLDGETKEPLPGASVFIQEVNRGILSNEKGEFEFMALCAGTYTVECSHFSYKILHTSLTIDKNTFRSFVLHADTCMFESVVVDTEKPSVEAIAPAMELKGKELDKTRGSSLGEALKNVPGVYTLQTGPSIFKPVIQGMYGTRVLILNNGIRQEGQQWGNEHAPEIDPFIANKITIIKGASSVRYGSDPIGGVILVDPRALRTKPGFGGEFNLAGFSANREGVASGIADVGFGKIRGLSARLQGTVKRAGNTKTPDYYLKNTGFSEYNFSGALGYDNGNVGADIYYSQFNTKIGIFSGSHIGNLSDLDRAIHSDVPLETSGFSYKIDRPYQQVKHELFKARNFYWLGNAGKLELVYARQHNYRAEFDKHRPYNDSLKALNEPELEFEITTHTGSVVFEHAALKSFSGSIGINGIYQANIFHGRFFIPNFRSYAGGIFLIERWKRKRLELEGGIRYDYKFLEVFKWEKNVIISPEYRFSNFSGSVGAIYTLNGHWQFRSNFGTAFRPPAVNELFSEGLHHGAASVEYGDRNLVPEVAYNITSTAAFQYKKIHGEVNVFTNFINDYIYLAPVFPATLTIRGAFPTFRYKQVDAVFYGTDINFVDSLSGRFVYSGKLSLIQAYNKTENDYLIYVPPARVENGINFLFKDKSGMKESYIGLHHVVVAKQRRVPANSDYLEPPAGYMLFNVDMGSTFFIGKQPVDLVFSVTNILNTRYRDYLDRFRYFNDAVGRNFILRIKVPFDFAKKSSY